MTVIVAKIYQEFCSKCFMCINSFLTAHLCRVILVFHFAEGIKEQKIHLTKAAMLVISKPRSVIVCNTDSPKQEGFVKFTKEYLLLCTIH